MMVGNQEDWGFEQREPEASELAADGRGAVERKKGLACPLGCNGGTDFLSEQTVLCHICYHHTSQGVTIPQWWLVLHDRWTCSGCHFLYKNSRKSCARCGIARWDFLRALGVRYCAPITYEVGWEESTLVGPTCLQVQRLSRPTFRRIPVSIRGVCADLLSDVLEAFLSRPCAPDLLAHSSENSSHNPLLFPDPHF